VIVPAARALGCWVVQQCASGPRTGRLETVDAAREHYTVVVADDFFDDQGQARPCGRACVQSVAVNKGRPGRSDHRPLSILSQALEADKWGRLDSPEGWREPIPRFCCILPFYFCAPF